MLFTEKTKRKKEREEEKEEKGVEWTVFNPATMLEERIYEEAEHPLEKIYAKIPCRSACMHPLHKISDKNIHYIEKTILFVLIVLLPVICPRTYKT